MTQIKQDLYINSRKKKLIAYLLLFFFGFLFIHRIYARRYYLFLLNLVVLFVCFFGAIQINSPKVMGVWSWFWIPLNILDIFLIPKMIKGCNLKIAYSLGLQELPEL